MIGVYILLVVLGLMTIGTPVTFAIASGGIVGLWLAGFGDNPVIIIQQLLTGIDKPALLAIPFFIFAGSIMTGAGLSDRIFNAAHAIVGHMRGGLAQVNVLASFMFAGVSGSSVADIAGIGQLEVRAMTKRGYPLDFSSALTVVTSILGPVLPPSITLIIYAWLAEVSVGRMLLAGVIPGAILAASFMIYVAIVAIRKGYPTEARLNLRQAVMVMLDGVPALVAPAVILAAMVFGITTITEAGILAGVYAIGLGVVYRNVDMRVLWDSLAETVTISALVMMIIGFSQIINWTLAIEQIPQELADLIFSHVESKTAFLVVLIVFLLFVGCFLDVTAALILLVPLLLPMADLYGIDRIQFGMVVSLGLLIGIATPPMGIGLYVMCGLVNVRMEALAKAILPMLLPVVITLILIAFIPELSLWLPDLMMN